MNPTAKLFALFSALALLLSACVTVRDCDGNRYQEKIETPLSAVIEKIVFLRTLFEEGKLAERLKAAVSKTARV